MSQTGRSLVFSDAEYQRRWSTLREVLADQQVDLAILHDADTIYYLTGFNGTPTTYQALLVPRRGQPVHVLRYAEERTLRASSWLEQGRFYHDWDDPTATTAEVAGQLAPRAIRLGVEKASMFLSVARFERLHAAIPAEAIIDLSMPIGRLRLIKSAEEIAMHRRAALAIERGLAAGIEASREGSTDRDIAAAMATTLIHAGADAPTVGIIASGERLGEVHAALSDRHGRRGDMMRLEQSNSVHRYWARIMRMVSIGEPRAEDRELFDLLRRTQEEQIAQLRPGAIPAELDAFVRERIPKDLWAMQLSGYALAFHERSVIGSEIDRLRITREEHRPIEVGMVFHMYLMVGSGISISETIAVGPNGPELLTTYPRDLIVR